VWVPVWVYVRVCKCVFAFYLNMGVVGVLRLFVGAGAGVHV